MSALSFNLTVQLERQRLADCISSEIEADTIAEYEEGYRWHLGASVIGRRCERELWSDFRWLSKERVNGQKHRLFKRGHFEEPKFIHRLRRIGFEIFEFDNEGKQFKIVGHRGHYGGSMDGVGLAPARYNLPGPILVEFKTHGEKSYAALAGKILKKWPELVRAKGEGVRLSKPEHYAQMCSYGVAYGFKYALYCAVNKNTDELYFEIVELDANYSNGLYEKAGRIIFSQTPPRKLSNSPAYFECKVCAHFQNCHGGKPPDRNCRSCENALPVDDGEWYCRVHNAIIPREHVPNACDKWRRIA